MRPEIVRRGPLDGVNLPRSPGVTARLEPFAQRFVLRGEATALAALRDVFGVAPPAAPMGSAVEGDRAALWLGPDEWLLLAEDSAQGLQRAIETALSDVFHSLVDVSHRQTALAVEGVRSADALNSGVALDLDPSAFPVGRVARTLFLKAEITLWRRQEHYWRVEVPRSFAPYFAEAFAESLASLP